jgi:ribosome-associated translation inhibitor RaiA
MKPSLELEALIRERAERLELLHQHIIGCRVTVDLQSHTHHSGNIPEVHIEIQILGKILVVNHERSREGDALTAVHDAFNAATRQIKEYKARKADHVKEHVMPGNSATD